MLHGWKTSTQVPEHICLNDLVSNSDGTLFRDRKHNDQFPEGTERKLNVKPRLRASFKEGFGSIFLEKLAVL